MDQFYSLFCNCWNGDSIDESKMDIIYNLPVEIAIMILRLLDPRALLAAILVNRKWFRLIRSDHVLRKSVRTELKKEREAQWNMLFATGGAQRRQPDEERKRSFFARKNNRAKVLPTHPVDRLFTTAEHRPQPLNTQNRAYSLPMHQHVMRAPAQSTSASTLRSRQDVHSAGSTAYPVRAPQSLVHSFARVNADLRDTSTSKAAKHRPSKKLLNNVKNRPATLRL